MGELVIQLDWVYGIAWVALGLTAIIVAPNEGAMTAREWRIFLAGALLAVFATVAVASWPVF
jgi:hypothetical protein